MTATYTFDIFSTLDGFGTTTATGAATGASKAPNCSTTALPCTARERMVFGAKTYRRTRGCWARPP